MSSREFLSLSRLSEREYKDNAQELNSLKTPLPKGGTAEEIRAVHEENMRIISRFLKEGKITKAIATPIRKDWVLGYRRRIKKIKRLHAEENAANQAAKSSERKSRDRQEIQHAREIIAAERRRQAARYKRATGAASLMKNNRGVGYE